MLSCDPKTRGAPGRNSSARPMFYISMKRVALVALLALVVVVLFVSRLWLRLPVRPVTSSPPQTTTEYIGGMSSEDFQTRLLEIVARAESATEEQAASLGRAVVVPDSSRN